MNYKFKTHLDWAREHHRNARAQALEAEKNGADYELILELQRLAAIAEKNLQDAESAS